MWADAKVLHLTFGDIILPCLGKIHTEEVAVKAIVWLLVTDVQELINDLKANTYVCLPRQLTKRIIVLGWRIK